METLEPEGEGQEFPRKEKSGLASSAFSPHAWSSYDTASFFQGQGI